MTNESTTPTPDPTPEPETAQTQPPESPAPEPPDVESPEADAPKGTPSHEAAKYRRRLRALEAEHATVTAERDGLAERLTNHDRREAERMAADQLHDPRDLWVRANVNDLRGEDGEIDAERVTAAVDDLVKLKPHWGKRLPLTPDPHQGARRDSGMSVGPSFGDALRRQVGR